MWIGWMRLQKFYRSEAGGGGGGEAKGMQGIQAGLLTLIRHSFDFSGVFSFQEREFCLALLPSPRHAMALVGGGYILSVSLKN